MVGALVSAALSVACSRTVPHDFDARKAHDAYSPFIDKASDAAELETLAVLLVPANTTVARRHVSSGLAYASNLYDESYFGPARVFLPPGHRSYTVEVQTTGGVLDFELDAEFKPGERYELHIVEDGEQIAFELLELHPSSYAAHYPDG